MQISRGTKSYITIFVVLIVVFLLSQRVSTREKNPLMTPYLDGFYRQGSFFDVGGEKYSLLYNHRPSNQLYEISLHGKLLRSLAIEKGAKEGVHFSLPHNGNLFSIVQVRGIEKNARDGRVVWYKPIGAHHDLAFDEQENIYSFDLRVRKRELQGRTIEVFDDDLVKLDSKGQELSRISLYPFIEPYLSEKEVKKATEMWVRKAKRHDILHVNSLFRLERDVEGFGPKGSLLISVRNFNLLLLLSYEEKKVLWSYQTGELKGQHHVTVTPDGLILLFDNGVGRKRSRILKIQPGTKKIVWEFSPEKKEFYTKRHGSAVMLPNGNILASVGDTGTIYEVSPSKEVVAKFELHTAKKKHVNPYRVMLKAVSSGG